MSNKTHVSERQKVQCFDDVHIDENTLAHFALLKDFRSVFIKRKVGEFLYIAYREVKHGLSW